MTLDHPVRSGLCHGPACLAEITEKSASRYFHTEGCQARWQAAHAEVGSPTPFWSYVRGAWSGTFDGEGIEALRPGWSVDVGIEAVRLNYQLGQRLQLGIEERREYEVTEVEPGRAVLTPVEEPDDTIGELIRSMAAPVIKPPQNSPKPIRRSWWKPNTWRRTR